LAWRLSTLNSSVTGSSVFRASVISTTDVVLIICPVDAGDLRFRVVAMCRNLRRSLTVPQGCPTVHVCALLVQKL
jgi:hypothetical protein